MIKKASTLIYAIAILPIIALSLEAAPVDFTPALTLSEEYTDNLYLVPDSEGKVDEYITSLSLGLITEIRGRTAGLEFNYTPSYIMFEDNNDLDYWRHYAHLNYWNAVGRNTRLELTSTYLETEDPRDQSDEAAPAIGTDATRRSRDRYRRNANELRLSNQFGSSNSIYGAVAYEFHEDVNPLENVEIDDYEDLRPSLGLEFWLGPRWGLVLDAYSSNRIYEDDSRYDRKEYHGSIRVIKNFSRRLSGYIQYQHTALDFDAVDPADQDTATADENYQISAPSIGLQYQLREDTNFRFGAGYYTQDFDESEDDTGSFADVEIDSRWNYRTSYIAIVAAAGYDIEDTGTEDLGLDIFYRGGITTGYNFTNRFSGEIYASYRYDKYPNQTPERTDQTLNARAGLRYQALRWMHFGLSYRYEEEISDIETAEFTENSILFSITLTPSSPLRLN